jgi:hypothetical protein
MGPQSLFQNAFVLGQFCQLTKRMELTTENAELRGIVRLLFRVFSAFSTVFLPDFL